MCRSEGLLNSTWFIKQIHHLISIISHSTYGTQIAYQISWYQFHFLFNSLQNLGIILCVCVCVCVYTVTLAKICFRRNLRIYMHVYIYICMCVSTSINYLLIIHLSSDVVGPLSVSLFSFP